MHPSAKDLAFFFSKSRERWRVYFASGVVVLSLACEKRARHAPSPQDEPRGGQFRFLAESLSMVSVSVMRAYSSWARKTAYWVRKSAPTILVIVLTSAGVAAQSIPSQPNLKDLFAVVGRMHNIDPELLEAMAEVESGGDPLSVSPKGALGLMQLMPATARAFSVLNPFNPVANTTGAADFLAYLRNRFANNPNLQGLPALLAAYNAGPGAVEKYGGIPPYVETNRYVRRVIERYTNDLSAQAAMRTVLILGPKPYVIQLTGSHAMQPEPVLISADSDRSVPNQLATIRSVRGQVVAVVGTGTAPWIRPNPTELSLHRAHKIGSSRNSAIVTLDIPLHSQNVARARLADHGNSR